MVKHKLKGKEHEEEGGREMTLCSTTTVSGGIDLVVQPLSPMSVRSRVVGR